MCGICGQLNFAKGEPVDPRTIRRMTDAIAHRGPDDDGYFVSESIGLGFRRLSIIDLAGGHQPLFDAENTVCVVFNGEIYNYKELREQLFGKRSSPRKRTWRRPMDAGKSCGRAMQCHRAAHSRAVWRRLAEDAENA